MCKKPDMIKGRKVACRRCNACLLTFSADWKARAMAERAMARFTYSITLTYGSATQEQRDGAMMFRYRDVKEFVDRLRAALRREHGRQVTLRFAACGEKGDRFKRVHWHFLLFLEYDVLHIGKIAAPWGQVTKRSEMISPQGEEWRRDWSLWPHGFVVIQEPDYAGVAYAMAYALKNQYTFERAVGTAREGKGEMFPTGYFRPSKMPPLGWPFLDALFRDMKPGEVLPNTRIKIPDMRKYWRPRGLIRDRLLRLMAGNNQRAIRLRGRPASQWSSLVAEGMKTEGDLRSLGFLPTPSKEQIKDVKETQSGDAGTVARQLARSQCFRSYACDACLWLKTEAAREAEGIYVAETSNGPTLVSLGRSHSIRRDPASQPAKGCLAAKSPRASEIFWGLEQSQAE